MITTDIEIAKEIFKLIDEGIVNGYDAFKFEVEIYDTFMERELSVENNGVEVTDAETDFNGAVLYDLVKQLKTSSARRGENWVSFIMSYRQGGEVKTNFTY